jgi:hypothetical protein
MTVMRSLAIIMVRVVLLTMVCCYGLAGCGEDGQQWHTASNPNKYVAPCNSVDYSARSRELRTKGRHRVADALDRLIDDVRNLRGKVGTVHAVQENGLIISVDNGANVLIGSVYLICRDGQICSSVRARSKSDAGVFCVWEDAKSGNALPGDVALALYWATVQSERDLEEASGLSGR